MRPIEDNLSWRQALLGLFFLSSLANALALAARPSWWIAPGLVAGWYLADLASGLIHMWMDYRPCPPGKRLNDLFFYAGSRESDEYQTMLRERMAAITPFERLVYDFKNHHPRPLALGRRSLWRLIGSTLIVGGLPLSLALNLTWALWPLPAGLAAAALAFTIGASFAQLFHAALHRERNPWPIALLRRLGLLMTPPAHQLHHDTLRRDFATNCGWSNPLVNRLFTTLRRRGYLDDSGLEPSS
ncbi:fatty acid desaturase CarF family protein [Novosphingobium bradum]|uniref:Fatty acid desaturase CarF family protein n=1 Tax=Novosphingobium bradum TaxID=1737444 RepID=A0ABV7INU6_9SPHN